MGRDSGEEGGLAGGEKRRGLSLSLPAAYAGHFHSTCLSCQQLEKEKDKEAGALLPPV